MLQGWPVTLHFYPGSLSKDTNVLVEGNPYLYALRFSPDHTSFGTPVDLTLDYSGTSLDPSSSAYTGARPAFYWLNESTGTWEELPGVDDRVHHKYTVQLAHFSEYALGEVDRGKAGW